MHLADRIDAQDGFVARPYRGPEDHADMARVLNAHYADHEEDGVEFTAASFDREENPDECDLSTDLVMIEDLTGRTVAYTRTVRVEVPSGLDCIIHLACEPGLLTAELHDAVVRAGEAHAVGRSRIPDRLRIYCPHPGPDDTPTGRAAWLEALDYEPTEWSASLLRPHLDDIPDLALPDGVEVRPVDESQLREILTAHHECFRGEWDFTESSDRLFEMILDDVRRDHTLWQVAWAGDTIVGQVKPFIDHRANEQYGRKRGYPEHISTHADWRNQGIAGALLARSLRVLRDRGMTEAMLGVDTNSPGGALHLYTRLGFEPVSFEAVYTKAL